MTCSRKAAWMIWVIGSVFYAYQYVLRVIPNILLPDIMNRFDIDAATFGQFSGIYYIGYSLMHLPIGILLDRYGPRKVMSICTLLNVVGMLPIVMADYWIYPIAGRLLVGIGSSAAILGLFKIIRMGFNGKQFARMLSLSVTIGLIGAIWGGGPVSLMREALGYVLVTQIFAGVGVLFAVIAYWVIPEMKSAPQSSVWSNIKEVARNGWVIGSCFFAGLMVGPLEGFADVWGSAFLKGVYGYEKTLAASIPSMIFVGMCFGGPILSFLAEKVGSYVGTVIAAGVMMIGSFSLLLASTWPPGFLSVSFVMVGICCAYQILTIYKASTYVREEVAGLTTAVANMIIMIFGYAFHTIIGQVVHFFGGPSNPQALVYGVMVIPIALCIGTGGFMTLSFLERRKTVSQASYGK